MVQCLVCWVGLFEFACTVHPRLREDADDDSKLRGLSNFLTWLRSQGIADAAMAAATTATTLTIPMQPGTLMLCNESQSKAEMQGAPKSGETDLGKATTAATALETAAVAHFVATHANGKGGGKDSKDAVDAAAKVTRSLEAVADVAETQAVFDGATNLAMQCQSKGAEIDRQGQGRKPSRKLGKQESEPMNEAQARLQDMKADALHEQIKAAASASTARAEEEAEMEEAQARVQT